MRSSQEIVLSRRQPRNLTAGDVVLKEIMKGTYKNPAIIWTVHTGSLLWRRKIHFAEPINSCHFTVTKFWELQQVATSSVHNDTETDGQTALTIPPMVTINRTTHLTFLWHFTALKMTHRIAKTSTEIIILGGDSPKLIHEVWSNCIDSESLKLKCTVTTRMESLFSSELVPSACNTLVQPFLNSAGQTSPIQFIESPTAAPPHCIQSLSCHKI